MEITAAVDGQGPIPGQANATVNISVEFNGPIEAMTISVIVPNEGTEAEIETRGIKRAKEFANAFAALP